MAGQWHYQREGKQFGPLTTTDLKLLASTGRLSPNDLVWREGLPKWLPAAKITGLWIGVNLPAVSETPAIEPAPVVPAPPRATQASLSETDFFTQENLSIESLHAAFDAAMFEVTPQKTGSLLVGNAYVRIGGQAKNIINFSVGYFLKAEVSEKAAHALCNRVNSQCLIIRANVNGPNVYCDWDLPPLGVIGKRTVILAYRKFCDQLTLIKEHDTENILKY